MEGVIVTVLIMVLQIVSYKFWYDIGYDNGISNFKKSKSFSFNNKNGVCLEVHKCIDGSYNIDVFRDTNVDKYLKPF